MIPVRVSFRYEIEFTWESFYLNDTMFAVSPRSYKPFWGIVAYRQAVRTHQLGHSSRTGTKTRTSFTWYRYRMWSDFIPLRNVSYQYENRSELVPLWLVPVQHFVLVSCKRIQSYKWALGELVPLWNSYRYETRTGIELVPVSICSIAALTYLPARYLSVPWFETAVKPTQSVPFTNRIPIPCVFMLWK